MAHSHLSLVWKDKRRRHASAAASWKRVYFHSKHLMRQDHWSINFNFIDLINVCCVVWDLPCPASLHADSLVLILSSPGWNPSNSWTLLFPQLPTSPSSALANCKCQATCCYCCSEHDRHGSAREKRRWYGINYSWLRCNWSVNTLKSCSIQWLSLLVERCWM